VDYSVTRATSGRFCDLSFDREGSGFVGDGSPDGIASLKRNNLKHVRATLDSLGLTLAVRSRAGRPGVGMGHHWANRREGDESRDPKSGPFVLRANNSAVVSSEPIYR